MDLDPEQLIPEMIAHEATLDSLLALLGKEGQWDEHPAQVLDHGYRERLVRALTERVDERELRQLRDHLSRAAHLVGERLTSPERPYDERWRTLRDLIENRLALLRSAAPESVLNRAHVRDILALVMQAGPIGEKAIMADTGLKRPNLTRILKLMEVNGLVIRRSLGREKQLLPGPNADRVTMPKVQHTFSAGFSALLSPTGAAEFSLDE